MMTSSRPRDDVGGSFASRRGHGPQLSISDPSHHVTEAIGTLYGDEDDYSNDNRPLSFMPSSAHPEHLNKRVETGDLNEDRRRTLLRTTSDQSGNSSPLNGNVQKPPMLPSRSASQRSGSSYDNGPKSPLSPTMSLRDSLREVQNEGSQFPMTNIEDPSDIAQELSNLQALRRMSMDVGNMSDPDLLPYAGMSVSAMPSIAPSGNDDEGDPSRLLWVPAAVHPELAPTEFKTFLEGRVRAIKRRSGESESMLSPEGGVQRSDSGLSRKKSMLSRQIDNSGGRAAQEYVDGSERLDSKRSSEQSGGEMSLDELVKDPTKAVQRLTLESQQQPEGGSDDLPILPMAVPGMGLRRSTRTTYRKGGSLRSGERSSLSKRISGRKSQQDGTPTSPEPPTNTPIEAPPGHGLTKVHSEPAPDNFSRPGRPLNRQQMVFDESAYSSLTGGETSPVGQESMTLNSRRSNEQLPLRSASGVSTEPNTPVPQILESPAAEEEANQMPRPYPTRSSSSTQAEMASQSMAEDSGGARPSTRPPMNRSTQSSSSVPSPQQQQQQHQQQQAHSKQMQHHQHQHQQHQQQHQQRQHASLNEMASSPSPVLGGGNMTTDSLTFIPTMSADDQRKSDKEKKSKKDKDDDSASVSSSRSGGWSKWLKGSSEREEKKKREEEKKKSKSLVEKAQDNVRLDVIQNSIESAVTKGRESLLLDRDNVDSRLENERKKESSRKSDPPRKEKEGGGLFSGLFGGGKKKADRDSSSKKGHHLRVSEDPPYRPLRPDVDYHWTRFPLLEERAIYRMAHIKLANPRRSLSSQVLLSNFMYNYLAIVQAMHPQIQVPQSPQQRRQEEERRRKEQEEQYLAQQQAQQESDQNALDQYNFEYHRGGNHQYGDNGGHQGGGVEYIDDAQIYEYEHGGDVGNPGGDQVGGGGYHDGYGGQYDQKHYYQQHDQYAHHERGDVGRRDGGGGQHDMW